MIHSHFHRHRDCHVHNWKNCYACGVKYCTGCFEERSFTIPLDGWRKDDILMKACVH